MSFKFIQEILAESKTPPKLFIEYLNKYPEDEQMFIDILPLYSFVHIPHKTVLSLLIKANGRRLALQETGREDDIDLIILEK